MNLTLLKVLQKFDSKAVSVKFNRYCWLLPLSKSNTGFTLIELLIATLIFSILAAIATPSWFSFISQQRLNKANDAILAALQEAQRQARITKQSYSVSFKQDTSTSAVPQVSIYPASSAPATWNPLGENIALQSGQVTLYTNTISTPNTIAQASSSQTVTFDYTGALLAIPSAGLKIEVAQYQAGTPLGTSISSNVKRQCVIVQTLIGSMQTAQDNGCS